MSAATLALQSAVYGALVGSPGLAAALGSGRIFDHVPRRATPPYVAIAGSTAQDWSTGSDIGDDHTLTLHIWSDLAGRAEVSRIMAEIIAALHDHPLTLDGFRLVNIRHERSETRRLAEADRFQGIVRFRAKTETLT